MNEYVNESFKESMKNINRQLEMQSYLQNKYVTYSKGYLDSLKEEIRLLEEKKKLIDNELNNK